MSGTAARATAQAKVNLFLRVLDREASGYHQLETLFCRLELGDLVSVRATTGPRSLDCSGPMMPAAGLGPVEQNLAWRAAAAFAAEAAWPGGFAIEIEKRLPVGGGLGGGSADAGAVLRILNALAPRPIAAARLLEIAAGLGADVPFAASEHGLSFGWGYGEQLEPLSPLPPRDCWLFCFSEGVATADAYRWLDEARAGQAAMHRSRAVSLGVSLWSQVARLASNDFEAVVVPRLPRVGEVLQSLRQPASRQRWGDSTIALLSGSGSSVFCLPETVVRGEAPVATRDGERILSTRTAMRVAPVEWLE
ncbi:MAG: 4-(cytidine 5'-diphospho)-2-C-methyl-D-erythritol kinase [Gemmatimonadetes bacterium]|nr:4-(cytidine 5'-diphospho)-2-C-methyl-D-erythritol kinase [Gemmatimonadota bacterium]